MLWCVFLWFGYKRLRRYLRYLQQEGYEVRRFFSWLWKGRAFDARASAIVLSSGLLAFFTDAALWLCVCALAAACWLEPNPEKEGKITLKMTDRAKRILVVSFALYCVLVSAAMLLHPPLFWVAQAGIVQGIPCLLAASVAFLSVDEERRQQILKREAKKQLELVDPYVIGITGSYGKTSAKHALSYLLQVTRGAVFWPSKGVNTEMGITREIRERLKPGFKYAVIEMGAYGPGSIAKLCSFTPPRAGLITMVGVAHLDRFGDQETIRKAKSELAQAIPFEGILVCNGDNPGARQIARENMKRTTLLYGFDNSRRDLACWISRMHYTPEGTDFVFEWNGRSYTGKTPLAGKAAVSNLAGCFAMACALGADPDFAVAACAHLRAVDNRLQVKREQGLTYIHDAYNSNPDGFADALDILRQIPSNKKILITPGMIELGELNTALHEQIGRIAAQVCDYTIVVGQTNRAALTQGLLKGGMRKEAIIHAAHRDEAFKKLQEVVGVEDAVLIENDLPDLYEAKERF